MQEAGDVLPGDAIYSKERIPIVLQMIVDIGGDNVYVEIKRLDPSEKTRQVNSLT